MSVDTTNSVQPLGKAHWRWRLSIATVIALSAVTVGYTLGQHVATPTPIAAQLSASTLANITPTSAGVFVACVGTHTKVKTLPTPVRVLDTRVPTGVSAKGAVSANSTTTVSVANVLPGATSVIGTFTVTQPAGPGFFTLWAQGPRPLASNLNTNRSGQTVADVVVVPLSAQETFQIYSQVGAQLIFDVSGGIYQSSGALRLIPSATTGCPANEQMISWNAVGPQGPAGPTGATGPQGPAGPGEQVFSKSGSYTVPSGVTELQVEAWGGGGGGGGYSGGGGGGGGGGAGGLVEALVPVTSGVNTCSVEVGSGGGVVVVGSGGGGGQSSVTCGTSSATATGGGGGGGSGDGGGGGTGGGASCSGAVPLATTSGGAGALGNASGGGGNGGGYYYFTPSNGGTGNGGTGTDVGTGGGGAGVDGTTGGNGASGLVIVIPLN